MNGLPLSGRLEFAVFLLVLPFLFSRLARAAYARLASTFRIWILGLSVLTILGKLALLSFGGYDGFLACYRSPVSPPPGGNCENSYENPFRRFSSTRIDRVLDFDETRWSLGFFNSLRFNIYPWVRGNVLRDRLPLQATWTTETAARRSRRLCAGYVGEGVFHLDRQDFPLPRGYQSPATRCLDLPPGRHQLRIDYRFDDGYRVGNPLPPGPYAAFRLVESTDSGSSRLLLPEGTRPWWARPLGGVVDCITAVFGMLLLIALLSVLGSAARLLLALAAVLLMVIRPLVLPDAGRDLWVIGAVLVTLFCMSPLRIRREILAAYLVVFGLTFFEQHGQDPARFPAVVYRTAGNDFLTYESFGRSILDSGSLEAGEPIFRNQGMPGYFSFLLHCVLGDGDTGITILTSGLALFGLLWLLTLTRPRGSRLIPVLIWTATGPLLVLLLSLTSVADYIRHGASETITWVGLPFAFAMLFVARSQKHWVLGSLLVGLCAAARPNQALALAALYLVFLARAYALNRRRAFAAACVALFAALIPVAHNLFYGHTLVLFTTSAGENTEISLGELRDIWSPAVRVHLFNQIRDLFFLGHGGRLELLSFHGLQIVWILGLAAAFVYGPRVSGRVLGMLLTLPVLYLLPHLFLNVVRYYPRHIIAPHEAMGVVTAWLCSYLGRPRHR